MKFNYSNDPEIVALRSALERAQDDLKVATATCEMAARSLETAILDKVGLRGHLVEMKNNRSQRLQIEQKPTRFVVMGLSKDYKDSVGGPAVDRHGFMVAGPWRYSRFDLITDLGPYEAPGVAKP